MSILERGIETMANTLPVHSTLKTIIVGKTPCEAFYCPKYTACKEEHLACESFKQYVNSGRLFPPNSILKHKKMKIGKGINPTRRIYNKLFSDCDLDEHLPKTEEQ